MVTLHYYINVDMISPPLRAIPVLPTSVLVVSYTPDIRDTTSVRYR